MSPQYLKTHSKHSRASGVSSGGSLSSGCVSGNGCHLTKSAACNRRSADGDFSDRLLGDSSCVLKKINIF